jgi:hypothetical protein
VLKKIVNDQPKIFFAYFLDKFIRELLANILVPVQRPWNQYIQSGATSTLFSSNFASKAIFASGFRD